MADRDVFIPLSICHRVLCESHLLLPFHSVQNLTDVFLLLSSSVMKCYHAGYQEIVANCTDCIVLKCVLSILRFLDAAVFFGDFA
jgi:hypothetical protein